jgi:IS30 family transposase
MKGYGIANELNVDPSTICRDIQYQTLQSQNYLDDLAKETLPFMYQTFVEGIRNISNHLDDKTSHLFHNCTNV